MSEQLFNNPEGHRGSAIVSMPMHKLYEILHERLRYVSGDFDINAVCQRFCVAIEMHQGTYPNLPDSAVVTELVAKGLESET